MKNRVLLIVLRHVITDFHSVKIMRYVHHPFRERNLISFALANCNKSSTKYQLINTENFTKNNTR